VSQPARPPSQQHFQCEPADLNCTASPARQVLRSTAQAWEAEKSASYGVGESLLVSTLSVWNAILDRGRPDLARALLLPVPVRSA
jgi:hypothetical protein